MLFFKDKNKDDKVVESIIEIIESWGYTPLKVLRKTKMRNFKKIKYNTITFFYRDKNTEEIVELLQVIYCENNGVIGFCQSTKEKTSSFIVGDVQSLKEMDEEIKK